MVKHIKIFFLIVFVFFSIFVNINSVYALTAIDSVTVTVTQANKTLSAVTSSGTGAGTVTGAGSYAYNTVVTLIATPDANSYFSSWSANCPSGQVTMDADKTCTATFTKIPPPTNLVTSCSANGTSASALWTLPTGYTKSYFRVYDNTISSALLPNYIPENVTDTGPSTLFTSTPGHTYYIWVHTRIDTGYSGAIADNTFTCPNPHTLTYTAGAGGTISGTASQSIAYGGSGTTVTASPNTGYSFVNWSDGLTTASRTDTNVIVDKSMTASFAPACTAPTGYTQCAVEDGTCSFTGSANVIYGCNSTLSSKNLNATSSIACTNTAFGGDPLPGIAKYCYNSPPMTGTLTSSSPSCVIASGASSCNVNLTWSTTNPITTSAVTATGMTNVNGNSGTNQAFSVPYNSRIFYLYNNSISLANTTVTSSCDTTNTTWNGTICADTTPPTAPGILTTTWSGDHWVNTNFVASTSGSSDAGSGMRGYRLCRSYDNGAGCQVWTTAGEHSGTSETVSGSDLPSPGTYRYYYWYAYDNSGNQSTNSPAEYVRLDAILPLYNSTSFTGCNYENGNNCYVKNGTTFYVNVSHTDNQAGSYYQYLEFAKNGANRTSWDGSTGNIKSYANPYGAGNGSNYSSFTDGVGMEGTGYLDIQTPQCTMSPNCNYSAVGKWPVVAGSGASAMYGIDVYMYDQFWNGTGYTDTSKYIYLDNTAPSVPTPTDDGVGISSSVLNFYASPSDSSSGLSTCSAQIDVNNTDGLGLALNTTVIGATGNHTWTGVPGNTYYYRYNCTDNVGNSSGWSAWSDGILIKQMTGTLTSSSPSCVIASGASSCNVTLTWSTTNPIATSAVTASGMTNVNGNSGSQAFAVPYNSRIFYLYNNAISLANTTVTSSCAANTTWNGTTGTCVLNSYTVTTSAGTGGSISPASPSVSHGSTTAFTITPSTGYSINTVTGCSGSLVGSTYTTGVITGACTVTASFTLIPPTGTLSASNCTITLGNGTCVSTVNWTTSNLVAGKDTSVTRNNPDNTTVSSNTSGSNVSDTINYGSSNYYLYHNSVLLNTVTVTASCASGTWNNTLKICATLPTLSTPLSSDIIAKSATLGATLDTLGYPASISARGVCYSSSIANPSIEDNGNGAICGIASGLNTGVFTLYVNDLLTPLTTYNYRGYATNAAGTGYSSTGTFKTIVLPPASTANLIASTALKSSAGSGSITINFGDTVTLSWNATNIKSQSCRISSSILPSANKNSLSASGSVKYTPTKTASYILNCDGEGGNSSSSIIINVGKIKPSYLEI